MKKLPQFKIIFLVAPEKTQYSSQLKLSILLRQKPISCVKHIKVSIS